MSKSIRVAPSEEYVLHCDVPTCPAQLSMVAGVNRSEHGWGRISAYGGTITPDYITTEVSDYDLCSVHYQEVLTVLRGGKP